MTNLSFFALIAIVAAALIAAFVAGIKSWRTVGGKITVIVAGLLLLVFAMFLSLVGLIVVSGRAGHPF